MLYVFTNKSKYQSYHTKKKTLIKWWHLIYITSKFVYSSLPKESVSLKNLASFIVSCFSFPSPQRVAKRFNNPLAINAYSWCSDFYNFMYVCINNCEHIEYSYNNMNFVINNKNRITMLQAIWNNLYAHKTHISTLRIIFIFV